MYRILYIAQLLDSNDTGLPKASANQHALNKILTIVFVIIGALAFLFLVIAGLKYILAQGDPAKITEAKNQILYAIIGLIVAASAGLVVNFVLNQAG